MKQTGIRAVIFTVVYLVIVIGVSMLLQVVKIPYLSENIINDNTVMIAICGMFLFVALENRRNK